MKEMALGLSHRLATERDLPQLRALMALSIDELQKGFLNPEQIVASRAVMGLDTQLVADGTYFVVEAAGETGRLWRLEPAQHPLWRRPFC